MTSTTSSFCVSVPPTIRASYHVDPPSPFQHPFTPTVWLPQPHNYLKLRHWIAFSVINIHSFLSAIRLPGMWLIGRIELMSLSYFTDHGQSFKVSNNSTVAEVSMKLRDISIRKLTKPHGGVPFFVSFFLFFPDSKCDLGIEISR